MSDDTTASGRFVVRIPPALHAELRTTAAGAGISLNEHCARLLSGAGGGAEPLAREMMERARATLGTRLIGVVLFGSWARGEASPTSDIDVLLVAAPDTPIVRALYERWDNDPFTWNAHAVEPHMVAKPDGADAPSGLWAEVALDGIIVHDPSLAISRLLSSVRRQIADGRIVQRSSRGGQTYWVEAA